ncbi:MAG: ribosome maturation factor RimP [Deltaproteobacteria bacterium]|nr:ribosome maturation factor RimP [Deltaproteobacteria bacterium]
MTANTVEDKVRSIVEPITDDLGLELVAVIYVNEDGRQILRLLIDRPSDSSDAGKSGNVTVGDCTRVSREVSTLLDVEDIVDARYSLEVSSPGLDRPLIRKKDFISSVGKKIVLKVKEAIDGRRNFKVTLSEASEGSEAITVTDAEGNTYEIEYYNIDRARLEVEL